MKQKLTVFRMQCLMERLRYYRGYVVNYHVKDTDLDHIELFWVDPNTNDVKTSPGWDADDLVQDDIDSVAHKIMMHMNTGLPGERFKTPC